MWGRKMGKVDRLWEEIDRCQLSNVGEQIDW